MRALARKLLAGRRQAVKYSSRACRLLGRALRAFPARTRALARGAGPWAWSQAFRLGRLLAVLGPRLAALARELVAALPALLAHAGQEFAHWARRGADKALKVIAVAAAIFGLTAALKAVGLWAPLAKVIVGLVVDTLIGLNNARIAFFTLHIYLADLTVFLGDSLCNLFVLLGDLLCNLFVLLGDFLGGLFGGALGRLWELA